MVKVIFLDWDGVIINRASLIKNSGFATDAAPECMAALNQIIEATDASVVISSSWRMAWTVEQMIELMNEWGFHGEIIGETPNYWNEKRGKEIEAWLQEYEHQHGRVESYVILDDDSDFLDYQLPYFVHTNLLPGLTAADAEKAIAILKGEYVQDEENRSVIASGSGC